MANPKTILIAGPTASGKSALALAIAERAGGVVINADSMQVYRELRILTARPTPTTRRAFRMLSTAMSRLARLIRPGASLPRPRARIAAGAGGKGCVPIIVGGTGLYFKALLEGLSPIPPIARGRARALACAKPSGCGSGASRAS